MAKKGAKGARKGGKAKVSAATKIDERRKPLVLQMRGTPEWKAWLERLASHCRLTVSGAADAAFVLLAEERGFKEKPPER